jgi:excisionase family DNA binding protein
MNTYVLAYPIADACRVIGCGRTTLYGLIGAGKIEARSLGSRTVIPAESLERLVASLPAAPVRVRK